MADVVKYEVGKWYGWNGGECPVHPKSEVEVVYTSPNSTSGFFNCEGPAYIRRWEHDGNHKAIAFRVVKEHKEPREFWAAQGEMCKCGQHGWIEVDRDCAPYATLFREVQS